MKITLCNINDIPDPGSRGFLHRLTNLEIALFVVHLDGKFYAYQNECTQLGLNLEWTEHAFLNVENAYIQCSNHGALFLVSSGQCISGPCQGSSLHNIALHIENEAVIAEFFLDSI